ncbi:hypothetical protein KIW84_021427 [Lathyrus oleraceus]|uniref:PB1-like domain-containing protein n=1 Tax=Pisum sativum TaxID=3888 RepID=A0A9D5B3Y9_PEA|nr:hypothetical protein KIW84_021427 [Pisum sativum]
MTLKLIMYEDMQHFNVSFHHGGEFILVKQNDIIYRGGVDTHVSGQHINKWTIGSIRTLVNMWGYKEGTYRLWTKIMEMDEGFFQITKDDDAYDFAAYSCATQVDGDIFFEHDVDDMKLRVRVPKCVNRVTGVEGLDDEVVERLDNSEDDKFGVTILINQGELVAGLLGRSNKRIDDDGYYSDKLDNSDPDGFGDEEGPKFERFRK